MTLDILGTKWKLIEKSEKEDERLKSADGFCDYTTKTIVIERYLKGTLGDMNYYKAKIKRHEIVHAFLMESGLAECSCAVDEWAYNEEMIDWFARQGEKIYKAWKTAGATQEVKDD